MSDKGSITRLIDGLKDGDQQANEIVWRRFHIQLLTIARNKLQSGIHREADEEDVVQNAFHSFYRRVSEGQFPQLTNRNSLWRLLVVITSRKSIDQLRRDYRGKKGASSTNTSASEAQQMQGDLEQFVSHDPTPEFAAQIVEEFGSLLSVLNDRTLESVAIHKMEGYTNDEIANHLGCSLRTVARKLDSIRTLWQQKQIE